MRFCLDRRVLLSLGAVALGVLVFAPSAFGRALPFLAFAACPLSMLLMMRAMSGGRSLETKPEPLQEAVRPEALRRELADLRSRQATIEAQVEGLGEDDLQATRVADVPE